MSIIVPKFEQVAFYVSDIECQKTDYRKQFGIDNWVEDTVTAEGYVVDNGKKVNCTNVAKLAFNHQLGFELELIRYVAGANWHQVCGRVNDAGEPMNMFQSHMAYHVDDMISEVARYQRSGLKIIQEVRTVSHTNPVLLKSGKRYQYVVFGSRNILGFDLKLIQRIGRD